MVERVPTFVINNVMQPLSRNEIELAYDFACSIIVGKEQMCKHLLLDFYLGLLQPFFHTIFVQTFKFQIFLSGIGKYSSESLCVWLIFLSMCSNTLPLNLL